MRSCLLPRAAIAGLAVLVPNDKYSNAAFENSIDDQIGKYLEREDAPAFRRGRAETGVLLQKSCDPLELAEEAFGNDNSSLLGVEVDCVGNILFGTRMQRVVHRTSLARRRAIASCPGTAATVPDSSSASLRSASSAHASSTSGSESRLAMRRSRSRERSAGDSFRASASRASKLVFTAISGAAELDRAPVACHNTPRVWHGLHCDPWIKRPSSMLAVWIPGKARTQASGSGATLDGRCGLLRFTHPTTRDTPPRSLPRA